MYQEIYVHDEIIVQLSMGNIFSAYHSHDLSQHSGERFQEIVNRGQYSYLKRVIIKQNDELHFFERSEARLGKNGLITSNKEEMLFSDHPLVYAYADGGMEYLRGFSRLRKNNSEKLELHFDCTLWMPSNISVTYSNRVGDKYLVEALEKYIEF